MRHLREDAPHFFARLRGAAGTAVGTRQIHPRVGELGGACEHALEQSNALGHLVLIEERHAQEPLAVHLAGELRLERTQQPFRGRRPTGTQRRVRAAAALLETARLRRVHAASLPCPRTSGYTRALPCRYGNTAARSRALHPRPPCALALLVCLAPAAWAGRALTPEDWYRFKDVSDLTMAPDGKAVAYLVTTYDQASDQSRSALWLADWAGNGSVELTRGESVSEPRFSPDGRYISFLAARPADAATQL